nr:MAG TPA: Tumor necrosis factor receptor superfamily Receptor 5, transmembrane helix [Caudoviricetes sp.]
MEAYEEWKAGKINEAEAGKKCKMNHARFRREAIKRLEESGESKQRKDGYGTHFPDNFREVCDLVLAGKITAAVGVKRLRDKEDDMELFIGGFLIGVIVTIVFAVCAVGGDDD